MITSMIGKLKAFGIALGLAIVAIGVAFWRGRQQGIEIMRREQDRARTQSIQDRKKTNDQVARMDGDRLDDEWNKWVR